jgi:hypothetical protein
MCCKARPVIGAVEIGSLMMSAILSQRVVEQQPPSTDCSASTECGGMRAVELGILGDGRDDLDHGSG